jgi:hypothetical protein
MTASIAGRSLLVGLGLSMAGSCGADGGTAPIPVRTMPMAFAAVTLQVELATTEAEREKGLMTRGVLPDTSGMLFVFSGDAVRDFWMKDTPVNLAIAFLDSARTIINVDEMTAQDLTIHHSASPARYALEVKEGWFAAHGLGPGAKATFTLPPGLTIDP